MSKASFAQKKSLSEIENVNHPSHANEFSSNIATTTSHANIIDLLHIAAIISNQASEEQLSASNKKNMRARMILFEFIIPEETLNRVNLANRTMKPTLAKMRVKIKTRNPNSRSNYYLRNKCVKILSQLLYLSEKLSALFNKVISVMKKCSKVRDTPQIVNTNIFCIIAN